MICLKKHTNIALGYFLLVGLLGTFLRLFFVTPIPANFKFVVHAHSHIALLGWVYIGLISLIYKVYFTNANKKQQKVYRRIFWFTQITLLGMLFSFPFQGYALYSITFSTLYLIASYFLAWFVFKNIPKKFKKTNSYLCIKTALWYMVFSSLGPWLLGAIMPIFGSTSVYAKVAIYFYLHFQYNAWFILVLCGILFYILEQYEIEFDRKRFQEFFQYLNIGLVLTFFLSVLWTNPPAIVYILAAAGALFQILAFIILFRGLELPRKILASKFPPFLRKLFQIIGILLIGKILMQLVSAIPFFADLAYTYTDFVIGYLHFTFLGVISISLFALLDYFQLIRIRKSIFRIYFVGFILSEILIFYRGISFWLDLPLLPKFYEILVGISALLPMAVGILLFQNITRNSKLPLEQN